MSDDNPFGDNPFSDPAVQQATGQSGTSAIDAFNPFDTNTTAAPVEQKPMKSTLPAPEVSSPAVLPTDFPPSYNKSNATSQLPPPPLPPPNASYGTASPVKPLRQQPNHREAEELRKQREDLEKREAELRRQQQAFVVNKKSVQRINNFPPLPDRFCVQPCFYQDFDIDIPVEFQSIVKTIYYLWLAYAILLLINVLAALSFFIADLQSSEKSTSSGVTFGISLLFIALFAPCSFVCWYRPLYKAFRSDSSLNFFVFFFIFFFQFIANIIFAIGFDGWGTVGIVSGLTLVTAKSASLKGVGTMMIVVGILFGILAAFDLVMLIRVHRVYRRTGASFEKAQLEFAGGVASNQAVQQAAGQAVSAGMRGAMNQPMTQPSAP